MRKATGDAQDHRTATDRPRRRRRAGAAALGDLPEWNLADLYPGMDAPELRRDLERAATRRGRLREPLEGQARGRGGQGRRRPASAQALREYRGAGGTDRPHRLLCRPGLCRRHVRPAARQALWRHPGEDDGRQRASAVLRAGAQPGRRRADRSARSMPIRGFGHYRPWVLDLRKDKPYQLEDRIEQLFHEKSITGRGAWNRLFDETMTELRFDIDGEELTLEPALNRLQDADRRGAPAGRRGAGRDLQQEPAHLHADHQHAGQGQGNLRPLARLPGHRRFPPPRQPRRARASWMRWPPPFARPIRGCRTATTR